MKEKSVTNKSFAVAHRLEAPFKGKTFTLKKKKKKAREGDKKAVSGGCNMA